MNTTGKRWVRFWLFLMTVTLLLAWNSAKPTHAQDTASLETECVAVVSASSFILPEGLTAEEYCKVIVAVLGEEWSKAAKLEATIIVVNELAVRLAAAEADIAALQAQNTSTLQPQIDAINAKLANVSAALQ